MDQVVENAMLTSYDIYLFKEGKHLQLFDKLGSHPIKVDGIEGVHFAVWAPNARDVSVIGDFNQWHNGAHSLNSRRDRSGIWEGFIPGLTRGTLYKYQIESAAHSGYSVQKGDPFCQFWELPPRTASIVWDLRSSWNDVDWMKNRSSKNATDSAWSIYEMHFGSWKRAPEDNNRWLTYREASQELPAYLRVMGFTHAELLPIMEHPYTRSWGYQTLGYFAPTSRFGLPEDFSLLVDELHRSGLGVVLDWVPSHFPTDEYGLAYYDGTHLYEHADPKKGYHPDWTSYIFDLGKGEVRSFLMSSANFWLEKYHADGLRVDGVASMLYLDYSRKEGDWTPNKYGGRENLESISFIRELNEAIYREHPDIQIIAEESTAWPLVSRPTYVGGLGFGMKWNMGWMHDTLEYMSKDPVYRKHHHSQLTFSLWYAFAENFVLPLSHDEVVYGKKSLLSKMPGDAWEKLANLRLLYGYMFGHPGKKLLFMGDEFGQWDEWNFEKSLDWHLIEVDAHTRIQRWVKDLNDLYRREEALHQLDFERLGFEWLDIQDWDKSIISFTRRARDPEQTMIIVCNFTPVARRNYRIGLPRQGFWREVLNSDALDYGGGGLGNFGGVTAENHRFHRRDFSVSLTLPPLSVLFFKHQATA